MKTEKIKVLRKMSTYFCKILGGKLRRVKFLVLDLELGVQSTGFLNRGFIIKFEFKFEHCRNV